MALVIMAALFLPGRLLSTEVDYSDLQPAHRVFKNGEKLFYKKRYDRAKVLFEKCVTLFPHHSRGMYYLSQIAYFKRDYARAVRYILLAKKNFGTYFRAMELAFSDHKAALQSKHMALKSAIADYSHTLTTTEKNCKTKYVVANLKRSENSLAETNWHLEKTFPDNAVIPSQYYFLHGNILFKQKKYKGAAFQYKMAVRINPKNSHAYNNLANLAYIQRDFRVARFYLLQAEKKGATINRHFKNRLNDLVTRLETKEQNTILPDGIKRFVCQSGDIFNPIFENCYLVFDPVTKDAVIIDPGSRSVDINEYIVRNALQVRMVINTHGHGDHVAANHYFAGRYQVDVWAHQADETLFNGPMSINRPDRFFKHGQILHAGSLQIEVLHTPGHTAGSVCFLVNHLVITGDSLFKGGIGSTGGATEREKNKRINQLITQIRNKLLILPQSCLVLAGHGEPTSIGNEQDSNPFLNKERSLDLLRESFKGNTNIEMIQPMDAPKPYDAKIVFKSVESLEWFRKQYGDKIVGLHVLLTTAGE